MSETATAVSRQYEIMFIVAGNKTDDVVKEVNENVKTEISSRGGKVLHEDIWGRREFAYPIRRQENGYYTVMHFELPSEKVNDLGKHLRLNTNVLRFLVTQVPADYTFLTYPALMAKGKREEKGGRGRGGRESDSIAAEGKTLQKRTPTRRAAAPAPARAASAPVAAAPAPAPAPVAAPVAPKEKVAKSEEDRLKELDQELAKLMKDDEI